MAKKKLLTVVQLVRALGLHGRTAEKVAKEALAQLSKAAGPDGKQGHALTLPGIGQVVGEKTKNERWVVASGKKRTGRKASVSPRERAKKAAVAPKRFRLVNTDTRGIRQVQSPATRSRLGIGRIRDAVVKASIGE